MSSITETNPSTPLQKFQQELNKVKVLNNYQLKNSCTDFLNSTNLEICVKSLLFEIIFYQTSYEKPPIFQIPVENIFQKEEIDFDKIYTDIFQKEEIDFDIIQEYLTNIDALLSSGITSLQKYFWLVTFPNIFGVFLSSESCIDAKNFIEKLFEFVDNKKLKEKENSSYAVNISLAVISFVSHNYLFYEIFYKTFFCELISDMQSNTSDFEVQFFNALKKALKKAALTFNQYQIEILQLYFKSTFPQINVIQSNKCSFQYQEILDKLIYPAIKIWDFSPYLQGNSILFKKEEGQSIYQKLQDYLSTNPDKVTELIQAFVDVIMPTNEQSVLQKEDDLVSFSALNLQKSSKVLTNLDIIIIKDIHNRIKHTESTDTSTTQSICKDRKKLMFYYQIIESSTQTAFLINSKNSSFGSSEDYFENLDLNKSVIDEFKQSEISERFVAQWLKLKERTKYGSDYDEIIKYQIGMLRQFNYYNNDNDDEKEAVDTFIKTGQIELEQDVKTRNFIIEKFRNFSSTIKINSNILDDILIPYSTSWILSLKKLTDPSLEVHVSNSFIETLKDFYSKYTKYEDPKNSIPNPSCIDLSNSVGDNSEFDLLSFILNNGKTQTTNTSDASTKKENIKKLQNDEYRSGKGSANIFYSFLLNERKPYNDIEIMETKRSINFLYKLYIDYIKRGLLLANTVSKTIQLMSDDQFKKTYKDSLNNLFLLDRKPTNASKQFYIILEQLLPFLSNLLKPLLYDLQENNNNIEVCLVLFENTTLLINKMLDQICIGENTQQLASYTILSAIKYIKKMPIKTKSIEIEDNKDMTDEELNSFCEKKLLTFYKFLANQNAYKNYPELQKLNAYFFQKIHK